MVAQVWILSADAVFARMLTLELEMQRLSVLCTADAGGAHSADVVLLDLDTALPPPVDCYRHMIGFAQNSASAADETRRLCSIVLRRPFELRRLREEIFSLLHEEGQPNRFVTLRSLYELESSADSEHTVLRSDGMRILLSPKEYAVFCLLQANRGSPVSRDAISREIGESSANKADVYICLLRKKLETTEQRMILTVRGKGYQLI